MNTPSKAEAREACDTCRFWRAIPDHGLGQCRFRAPVIVDAKQGFYGVFPALPGNEWCGDYQPDAAERARRAKELDDEILF